MLRLVEVKSDNGQFHTLVARDEKGNEIARGGMFKADMEMHLWLPEGKAVMGITLNPKTGEIRLHEGKIVNNIVR